MKRQIVTLDTEVLNGYKVRRLRRAARGLPFTFWGTTVSDRETKHSDIRPLRKVFAEPWVLGDTPLGVGAIVSEAQRTLFEQLLVVMSSGAVPKRSFQTVSARCRKRKQMSAQARWRKASTEAA
jgi:hypothetical protein